jgi:hypothetical protein
LVPAQSLSLFSGIFRPGRHVALLHVATGPQPVGAAKAPPSFGHVMAAVPTKSGPAQPMFTSEALTAPAVPV